MTDWLLPYRFSLLPVTLLPLAGLFYLKGMRVLALRGNPVSRWRMTAFFIGLVSAYAALHTRFDYLGQYLFFMHRAQHLVLHHLAAVLVALGDPRRLWGTAFHGHLSPLARRLGWLPLKVLRVLQHPVTGSLVFVGLIYLWLIPDIHFDAMLSQPLYELMNWSMLLDGVIFWMVILDPRSPQATGSLRYGIRLAMIVATMIPQIVLGAHITFSRSILYDVYSICGRAWPISPATDQILGGVLTWIPPAMMEVIAALLVLSMLMRSERNARDGTCHDNISATEANNA